MSAQPLPHAGPAHPRLLWVVAALAVAAFPLGYLVASSGGGDAAAPSSPASRPIVAVDAARVAAIPKPKAVALPNLPKPPKRHVAAPSTATPVVASAPTSTQPTYTPPTYTGPVNGGGGGQTHQQQSKPDKTIVVAPVG